jgi:hypothetical protein
MSSPINRIDPGDDPYAPRWARNSRYGRVNIHSPAEIGGDASMGSDQSLINGFRVPRSLDPDVVPEPWLTQQSRFGRSLGVVGYLAIAAGAAALVVFIAIGKVSVPGTIGAAERVDNRASFEAHSAIPVRSPPAEPGAAERRSEPRTLASSGEEPPPTPIVTALAPAARMQVPTNAPTPAKVTPALRSLGPQFSEVATLVERGEQLAATGDMAAARLLLRRAAEAHNARAALALAATYDPNVLHSLGIYGVTPDIAQARSWYEKAKEYGSAEALERIEMLAGQSQ